MPASTFAAEILVKKFCSGLNASEFLSNALNKLFNKAQIYVQRRQQYFDEVN